MTADGTTWYSEEFKGNCSNYHAIARVDVTDGYVGISTKRDGEWQARVLLTPSQWRKIVAFVEGRDDG